MPATRSTYLDYLPGLYQESEFLGRFLLIFEHILSPIDRTIGNVSHFFDPDLAPAEMLPWLASWLGVVLDVRVPEERRRDLVRAAPELYRWRGTKRGLREYLRLYTGIEPEITEPSLSEIASTRQLAFRFTVRMALPAGSPVEQSYIESIIDAEKPAFAACTLEVVRG
ncbi:MAG TPA: phage tail protein [Tepidiformaceae bacterium]|nr:phage tail protein [Tepidiformaceae bacterium]